MKLGSVPKIQGIILVASVFLFLGIAGYCQVKPPEVERFGPIDSTLVILEVPKNPCEYAEPFFVYVGIRNTFHDTLWIEELREGDELVFLYREGIPMRRPKRQVEFDYTMITSYIPVAPGDSLMRAFDLSWNRYAENMSGIWSSRLELPAFPVGPFRLKITYSLYSGNEPFSGIGLFLGKVSRSIDLEVLEPSPERRQCIELTRNGLFDLDSLGIDPYFELRQQIEKLCPQSGIVQILDVSFSRAVNRFVKNRWIEHPGQPVPFDLSKVETVLLDVARRYEQSGEMVMTISSLYYAYRAQDAKAQGLRVLGEVARENLNSPLGTNAAYFRSQVENNWQKTISFDEFRQRHQGKQ